jgi:hypothetical protein
VCNIGLGLCTAITAVNRSILGGCEALCFSWPNTSATRGRIYDLFSPRYYYYYFHYYYFRYYFRYYFHYCYYYY